jgi:hypothetical protein
MMAFTSGGLETGAHALGTADPCHTGRPARLFFVLKTHGPHRTTGIVGALPTRRLDPEPHDTRRTEALPAGPKPWYT